MERVPTFEPASPEAGGQCLQSIDMTGFSRFTLGTLQCYFAAGGDIFFVFANFSFQVLHKYYLSASGLSIPSEATPSIISVTT